MSRFWKCTLVGLSILACGTIIAFGILLALFANVRIVSSDHVVASDHMMTTSSEVDRVLGNVVGKSILAECKLINENGKASSCNLRHNSSLTICENGGAAIKVRKIKGVAFGIAVDPQNAMTLERGVKGDDIFTLYADSESTDCTMYIVAVKDLKVVGAARLSVYVKHPPPSSHDPQA